MARSIDIIQAEIMSWEHDWNSANNKVVSMEQSAREMGYVIRDFAPYTDAFNRRYTAESNIARLRYELQAARKEQANQEAVEKQIARTSAPITAHKRKNPAPSGATAESLTKRGFIFLEDSEWENAKERFDNALDIDPEYAPAYIGLLCIELSINYEHELSNQQKALTKMQNFNKATRFADPSYCVILKRYNENVLNYIAQKKQEDNIAERAYKEHQAKCGNSVGNIANEGLFAQQGDWIYYESDYVDGLYKIRTDGSGKFKLNNTYYNNQINILGDYIYFSGCDDKSGNGRSFYKIRTDGSGIIKLVDNESCVSINVVGDWVYYCLGFPSGAIYKMRTNGSGIVKLSDDESAQINVVGDWIYYTHSKEYGQLYKIRTDGSGKAKLNNKDFSSCFNVVNNWIYYSNDRGIYKIRIDGSGNIKISDNGSYFINVVNDLIYYSNSKDNHNLYIMRTDGNNNIKLNNDVSYKINITNDWVYYLAKLNAELRLYKIRKNGTQRQIVD